MTLHIGESNEKPYPDKGYKEQSNKNFTFFFSDNIGKITHTQLCATADTNKRNVSSTVRTLYCRFTDPINDVSCIIIFNDLFDLSSQTVFMDGLFAFAGKDCDLVIFSTNSTRIFMPYKSTI